MSEDAPRDYIIVTTYAAQRDFLVAFTVYLCYHYVTVRVGPKAPGIGWPGVDEMLRVFNVDMSARCPIARLARGLIIMVVDEIGKGNGQ
jgi:hypothetical protein